MDTESRIPGGLASHLGVLLNIPSVGVSEELLYGECKLDTFAEERGSRVPVVDPKDKLEIGAAVRTRNHVRSVFVSVGHRISLESAIRIVRMHTSLPIPGTFTRSANVV